MKKLQVLRVDNDVVQKMDLQIGNNIVSRNVVIGSDDERIIKQAAMINVTSDNEMTITPVSPCYMKCIESSQWKLLKLGATVPIKPGDICSLVPDKCCFKIISVPDKVEYSEEYTLKRKANEDVDLLIPGKKVCAGEGDNLRSSSNVFKKMLNHNDHNNVTRLINEKHGANENNLPCDTIEDKMNAMEEDKTLPESQMTDELRIKDKDARRFENNSGLASSSTNNNSITADVQPATSIKADEPNAPPNRTVNFRREKCKYAEKCYRKSSEHKSKFSHPSDADYNIPDGRAECPYGKKCYRKNPEHKAQFKHSDRNTTNKESKRTRKQPQIQKPLDTSFDVDDSTAEESVEESVDESDYDPASDNESTEDDEMYSDKYESDWDDD